MYFFGDTISLLCTLGALMKKEMLVLDSRDGCHFLFGALCACIIATLAYLSGFPNPGLAALVSMVTAVCNVFCAFLTKRWSLIGTHPTAFGLLSGSLMSFSVFAILFVTSFWG